LVLEPDWFHDHPHINHYAPRLSWTGSDYVVSWGVLYCSCGGISPLTYSGTIDRITVPADGGPIEYEFTKSAFWAISDSYPRSPAFARGAGHEIRVWLDKRHKLETCVYTMIDERSPEVHDCVSTPVCDAAGSADVAWDGSEFIVVEAMNGLVRGRRFSAN